ncbi:hypothetical protein K438DRAFT_1771196 [Mycena galopus ATCC 62051]|nr:hypothetical protein K438DRAFT_1771196 [Mycena galopus ATCC 62051]
MHPQKLALTVPSLLSTRGPKGFKGPLFLFVTHLDLFQGSANEDQSDWQNWSGVAALPALTHRALSTRVARDILANVVAECRNLAVVVVATYSWDRDVAITFAEDLTLTDPRVVVISMGLTYAADWKLGAWGGADFWVRAESAGEIDRASYLLDENESGSTQLA